MTRNLDFVAQRPQQAREGQAQFGFLVVGEFVGKKVHLVSGTLAPLLKRLEKQGLINRIRPDNNERKLFLALTKQGEELRNKAVSVPREMDGCIPLTDEELTVLKKLLDKALVSMDIKAKEETKCLK